MSFDPDKYLTETKGFNPDEYLSEPKEKPLVSVTDPADVPAGLPAEKLSKEDIAKVPLKDFGQQAVGAVAKGGMRLGSAILQTPKQVAQLVALVGDMPMGREPQPGDTGYLIWKENKGKETAASKYMDVVESHKRGVQSILTNHPEWESAPPENFKDLLTSPKKLSLAILESTPVLAAAGVATLSGRPDVGLAMMYAAEGQDAYDQALTDGASKKEATAAYHLYGSVSAILENLQLSGILKIGKGSFKTVAAATAKKVAKQGVAAVTKDIVKVSAQEALEEMAQGSWQELTAKTVYDKSIPDGLGGFIDRRLQEGLIGFTMGVIPGSGGAVVGSSVKTAGKAAPVTASEATGAEGVVTSSQTKAVSERFQQLSAERDNYKPNSPEWNSINEQLALESEAMRPKGSTAQESQAKAVGDLPLSGSEVVGQKMVQTAADLANVGQKVPTAKPASIASVSEKASLNIEDAKKYTAGLREPAVKELRARQAADYQTILSDELAAGTPPADAMQKARAGFRDKAETFKVPSPNFTPDEMNVISSKIIGRYKDVFKANNAKEAFDSWNNGEVLQRSQYQYIEDIVGKKTATGLYEAHEALRAKNYNILSLENDIQAASKLIVSLDVQIARQASSIATRHPILFSKAVGINARAYVSEKYAEKIEARTKNSPYYQQASDDGVNRLATTAYSGERAEQFSLSTHLTQKMLHTGEKGGKFGKIAGAPIRALGKISRGAERGFAAAHDYLVQSMYDTAMGEFEKAGLPVTPKMQAEFTMRAKGGDVAAKEALAKAQEYRTNRASAINTLVKVLRSKDPNMKKIQAVANHVLFSASVTTARFKVYSDVVTKAGSRAYIGSAIATDIAKIILVSSLTTLIGKELADRFEWARKEDGSPKLHSDSNPSSSNWGKIVNGDTSIDIGGGEIQKYRFLARLISGKTKTQAGEIKKTPRKEVIEQYLKGRGNPVLGLIARWWTGRDFMGNSIWEMPDLAKHEAGEKGPLGKEFAGQVQGLQNVFGEKAGKGIFFAGREVANALAPQILAATWEAAIDQGWAQTASRASLEMFSQSTNEVKEYASTVATKMKNKLAEEKHGKKWDELSDVQQKQIRGYSPTLRQLEAEVSKEKTSNFDYIGETLAEQQKVGKKVQKGLDKDIQTQMESLGVGVGGLSKKLGDWKLNDARYKAYQEKVKEVLNPRLREIMGRPMWSDLSNEQKIKAIRNQIDKSKEIARNKVKGESHE
jgi:hypothetical protein